MTSFILAIVFGFGNCGLISLLDDSKEQKLTFELTAEDIKRDNLPVKEFWKAWHEAGQPTYLKMQDIKLSNGEGKTFRTDLSKAEARIQELQLKEDSVFPSSDGNKYRLPEDELNEKNELTAKVEAMKAQDAERHRRLLETNPEYRRLDALSEKLNKPWLESFQRRLKMEGKKNAKKR